MLEDGETSINKLSRIASIATLQNEEELAAKIKVLPKSALDTLVRDVKGFTVNEHVGGSQKPLFDGKNLPGHDLNFQLSDDVTEELNELHAKGIDMNELLREMLKRRREEITKAKAEIAETIEPTKSRYLPVQIKKILHEEYGEKCSITACRKPSEETHHTQRFTLRQNHDPRFLAPLCSDHHVIAHSLDMNYHWARAVHASFQTSPKLRT